MKFTKIFLKILISLVVPFLIIFFSIEPLYNSFNLVRIGTSCCGLTSGDIVRYKEFNPLTLKHGDVIFDKDSQGTDGFSHVSHVIAFPGEYVFRDLYTGKWGYIKLDAFPKMELSEHEIAERFSDITWLDVPTFQGTIPSENLYERLGLITSSDITKYQVASEIFTKDDSPISIASAQIYGVYDSVFINADNALYLSLALIVAYLLLVAVTYDLLSQIFIKLKKKKSSVHSLEHKEKS